MSIKRLARRRPSPAMVVACFALFVALGGTSYAFAVGSIGSREIRDGSIRNVDVRDGSLRGVEFKTDSIGGRAIDEQALDPSKLDASRIDAAQLDASQIGIVPVARTALNVLTPDGLSHQALIASDGGSFHTRGVVSVDHPATGRYEVVFDRDLSSCAYSATLTEFTNANPGKAGTGEIAAQVDPSDTHAIHVGTANSSGDEADRGFALLVSC